jgi:hypothetical protein
VLPNTARLVNPGPVPAPVWATYTGDLSESRLTDGRRQIRLAPLATGQQILVATESLHAPAPGGATRAAYVLAGSDPLMVPPRSVATWRLYGLGSGSIILRWRGAWA